MKTVKDIMTTDVVWVSPSARVKTAVILLKGHNIGALPVVHSNESVVGVVTCRDLLGEPQDSAVMDVMDAQFTTIDPDTTVYDAAEVMLESRTNHLFVIDEGRLAGIISGADIIPELGKNFDPLTELPYSDTFRDWAMNSLKRGMEISVIFFDLDKFGKFNKQHGHVVGDTVLKEVSKVIRNGIDPDLDLACRYGGDEFAIVSVRLADEAIALADVLQEQISQIKIDGVGDVSATYGMYGGRRTKEREDMHYAATIDDLITRASKDAIARKPHRGEQEATAPMPQPVSAMPMYVPQPSFERAQGTRLKIENINVSTSDVQANVGITLTQNGIEYKREAGGFAIGGKSILRLVAEATAGAACRALVPGYGVVIDDLFVSDIGEDDEIVTVVATFVSPMRNTRHVGSCVVRRNDRYRATAAALLAAVNRLIDVAPRAAVEPEEAEAAG